MNLKIATVLLVAWVSAGAGAEDQIYKWRDAQGVWHFSSEAPRGVGAERVSIRHSQTVLDPEPTTAPAGDAAGGTGSAPATATATASAGANRIVGPQSGNCKSAQDAVAVLSNNARVVMDMDGDGKQEELSAQQQIEELERRRAQAKVYCAEA